LQSDKLTLKEAEQKISEICSSLQLAGDQLSRKTKKEKFMQIREEQCARMMNELQYVENALAHGENVIKNNSNIANSKIRPQMDAVFPYFIKSKE
jgi:hypothetical protein